VQQRGAGAVGGVGEPIVESHGFAPRTLGFALRRHGLDDPAVVRVGSGKARLDFHCFHRPERAAFESQALQHAGGVESQYAPHAIFRCGWAGYLVDDIGDLYNLPLLQGCDQLVGEHGQTRVEVPAEGQAGALTAASVEPRPILGDKRH
jgi:hypothetical protein